jgi:hypothetical protein
MARRHGNILESFKLQTAMTKGTTIYLEGGGGYGFFLKKYSDSQCCWKYSDFGGEKKNNNLIQSFCHKI